MKGKSFVQFLFLRTRKMSSVATLRDQSQPLREGAAVQQQQQQPCLNMVHGRNANTSLKIHLMGATITSWKLDGEEMLYLSRMSTWDGAHHMGIRGGVALFFPHIGPWMHGPTNGFAKTSKEWKVVQSPQVDRHTGDVTVALALEDSDTLRRTWSRKFVFTYTITLGRTGLVLQTNVVNKGNSTLSMGLSIRPHFLVPDVTKCQVGNMNGLFFTDKAQDGWPAALQRTDLVSINGYVDSIFSNAPEECHLSGLSKERKLVLSRHGFQDVAVWNPWNKFKLPDMPSDDYRKFICVDASQFAKKVSLKAGQDWTGVYSLTVIE